MLDSAQLGVHHQKPFVGVNSIANTNKECINVPVVAKEQGKKSSAKRKREKLWTGPGLRSAISVRELISTLKKKNLKNRRWVSEWSGLLAQILGKSHQV